MVDSQSPRIPDDMRTMILRDLTKNRNQAMNERLELYKRIGKLDLEIEETTSAIIYLRKERHQDDASMRTSPADE